MLRMQTLRSSSPAAVNRPISSAHPACKCVRPHKAQRIDISSCWVTCRADRSLPRCASSGGCQVSDPGTAQHLLAAVQCQPHYSLGQLCQWHGNVLAADSNCNFHSLTTNINIRKSSILSLPLAFHSAACRHGVPD